MSMEEGGPDKLLEFVRIVSVGEMEHFDFRSFIGQSQEDLQIAAFNSFFKKYFGRKVEDASEAVEIKVHTLLRPETLSCIHAEFGKCELMLGQFFTLLLQQGKGAPGKLLTDGRWNIAYIHDVRNTLWGVGASWSGGWVVSAFWIGESMKLNKDSHVLSR